jgi:hypothetical protein
VIGSSERARLASVSPRERGPVPRADRDRDGRARPSSGARGAPVADERGQDARLGARVDQLLQALGAARARGRGRRSSDGARPTRPSRRRRARREISRAAPAPAPSRLPAWMRRHTCPKRETGRGRGDARSRCAGRRRPLWPSAFDQRRGCDLSPPAASARCGRAVRNPPDREQHRATRAPVAAERIVPPVLRDYGRLLVRRAHSLPVSAPSRA